MNLVIHFLVFITISTLPTHQKNQKNQKNHKKLNDRPVIAILTVPEMKSRRQSIPAGYVKLMESAGARVLPVFLNKSNSYYHQVISQTNGLLFPGGPQNLNDNRTIKFIQNVRSLFNEAIKTNQRGKFYPIYGICLGMELLTHLVPNATAWLWNKCQWENYASKLEFIAKPGTSKIFKGANNEILKTLKTQKAVFHNHKWCLPKEAMKASYLKNHFNKIAISKKADGSHTVSVIEHKTYPFYGTIFNPERVIFEQNLHRSVNNTPHSYDAVTANQHFANFFLRKSRKSANRYPDDQKSTIKLINSLCPVFTPNLSDSAVYYFPYDQEEEGRGGRYPG